MSRLNAQVVSRREKPLQSHSTSTVAQYIQSGHSISVLRANESESPLEQESAGPAIIHAVDTRAASEERSKFQRTVGRWDTTFLMLAAIIVLDTLGAVSSYGAQSFTWLIVMVVFFLVPYGLITAELGTAFAEEGGPYVWVKLAFGRAAAAVVATMYWVDNPIWLAGTLAITAMAAFSTFFVDLSLSWQYVFGLLFIWARTFRIASRISVSDTRTELSITWEQISRVTEPGSRPPDVLSERVGFSATSRIRPALMDS